MYMHVQTTGQGGLSFSCISLRSFWSRASSLAWSSPFAIGSVAWIPSVCLSPQCWECKCTSNTFDFYNWILGSDSNPHTYLLALLLPLNCFTSTYIYLFFCAKILTYNKENQNGSHGVMGQETGKSEMGYLPKGWVKTGNGKWARYRGIGSLNSADVHSHGEWHALFGFYREWYTYCIYMVFLKICIYIRKFYLKGLMDENFLLVYTEMINVANIQIG